MSVIKNYSKKGVQPMRQYVPGEDLTGVSVSEEDTPEIGGMIAIGKDNAARWYVSKTFFTENYVLVQDDVESDNRTANCVKFVRHIEEHLEHRGMKELVECKICGLTLDDIAEA